MDETDPNLWLEGVDDPKALAWVEEQNKASEAALTASDEFEKYKAELLGVYDSNERIPYVGMHAGLYYNFWQDADHVRGIWRRTTPEQYREEEPEWELILDLDALAEAEGESWVWKGGDLLPPACELGLISLSRGGGDAVVVREFDLRTKSFVEDGFRVPEAKTRIDWVDENAVLIGTDTGEGSLTSSGYPRTANLWKRGTKLEEARQLYAGEADDVSIGGYQDHTPGFEKSIIYRAQSFYTTEMWIVNGDELQRIEKPDDAQVDFAREWLLLTLHSDYELEGTTHPSGSVIAARLDAWMSGDRTVEVIYTPTERSSLVSLVPTRNHIILNELDNVRNRIWVLTPGENGFKRERLAGMPDLGNVSISAQDATVSDDYFMTATGYLTPTTFYAGAVGDETPVALKSTPELFDASGLKVSQHHARSADGTMIPYFEVGPTDQSGPRPTLLYGYGGFRISMLPGYRATVGRVWLKRGGVYVVANIRGGGEFGPRWHSAALKENRPRAYEDFIAVAEDLIRRGVTTTSQLGIQGGSNGGLLMGNMLTMRPDLFGAVVCQVPLLDMKRYHLLLAGASWMAEYGDPDVPEEWEYIKGFSPYHNLDPKVDYPPTFFATSTRDDRVHPGHARKMVARMQAQGHGPLYYENTEGGHAAAANNGQRAFMSALAYSFLWKELGAPVDAH